MGCVTIFYHHLGPNMFWVTFSIEQADPGNHMAFTSTSTVGHRIFEPDFFGEQVRSAFAIFFHFFPLDCFFHEKKPGGRNFKGSVAWGFSHLRFGVSSDPSQFLDASWWKAMYLGLSKKKSWRSDSEGMVVDFCWKTTRWWFQIIKYFLNGLVQPPTIDKSFVGQRFVFF